MTPSKALRERLDKAVTVPSFYGLTRDALTALEAAEALLQTSEDQGNKLWAKLADAEAEIERLQQQLGECRVGFETGTRAIEENLRLQVEIERLRAGLEVIAGSEYDFGEDHPAYGDEAQWIAKTCLAIAQEKVK